MLVRAIGRAGAGGRVVEAGRLCAWVDEVPAVMDRAALLEHHRIVEGLGECLPVRFGTIVEGEAALVEMLRGREEELLARLERVAGKRELAVTGLWRAAADAGAVTGAGEAGEAGGSDGGEAGAAGEGSRSDSGQAGAGGSSGPGRRYMEQRRARARRAERARALAEEVLRLAGVAEEDARHVVAPSEGVAFSSALLVVAESAQSTREKIEALELAELRLLVHGPWPPYTFAG